MKNRDLFIERYKSLEHAAKKFYNKGEDYCHGKSFNQDLKKDTAFDSWKIDYCREIRNLLQHEEFKDGFWVEPTDAIIDFLEETIKLLENPPRISDIWIPKRKILTACIDDEVLPIMNKMRENAFTHVPVVDENGVVTGVFNENTLFQYFSDKKIINVGEGALMAEYRDYLPIETHIGERFEFVKKDITLYEVKKIFRTNLTRGKRTEMIFATDNGKKTEEVLGIVTAWDVLGRSKK
jgi:CBS domain-containing protein